MPTYDYHCPENQQTLTVQHGMKESIKTWGELCTRTQTEPGNTALDAAVERVISGGIALPIASPIPQLPMSGCCGNPSSCGHGH
ncbi:zinc ribbon domain-containing protein [Schlesneria sp.]|uniref:zinc ribbon domain-containing protein n=1 Tax=Schlesneria sp. TaxID=2762018 RepID=UPI002F246842